MAQIARLNDLSGTNAFPLVENPSALTSAIGKLLNPDYVSAVIMEGDSMLAGTGAGTMVEALPYKFRNLFLNKVNSHFGGAAKSGPGRFGPFFPGSNFPTDVDGPIIIPTGSGWQKWAAGSAGNTYWTEPFRQVARHAGGTTPNSGNNWQGCYVMFNPAAPFPAGAKWISVLFNGGEAGLFRVQARQGASITVRGSTGADRYKMPAGAFAGADVPDPSSATDRVFTVDINPANYPDLKCAVTGHLNSSALDPALPWVLCIYRIDNAATTVEITGFDAHWDEYTAQNTPRADGATTITFKSWPGDTDQGEQGGASSWGTNSDYSQQYTQRMNMMEQSKSYIHPKYVHSMPRAVMAVSNEFRNVLNNVDNVSGTISPSVFASRLEAETLAYAQAGISHLYLFDGGASASFICWGPGLGSGPASSSADDYRVAISGLVSKLKGYQGTKHLDGGLTVFDLDYAFGQGGTKGYADASMFWSSDKLHWSASGQTKVATVLSRLIGGDLTIGKAKANKPSTRTRIRQNLSQRVGVGTTVLQIDPHDTMSIKTSAGVGYCIGADNEVVTSGIMDTSSGAIVDLTTVIRGGANQIRYRAELFGERSGIYFENAARDNRIVETIAPASLTQFTLFVAMQNLAEVTAGTLGTGAWLHLGDATADGRSFTSVYDSWDAGAIYLGFQSGLAGGVPHVFLTGTGGNKTALQVGNHPSTSGKMPSDPFVAMIQVDLTAKTVRANINPSQSWTSTSLHATIPATFAPTRLAIGGFLGTGAACMPMSFGGLWLVSGALTDAEIYKVWDAIQGESGNWFQSGTAFGNYGAMNLPR